MTPSHYPESDGTVRVLDTGQTPEYAAYQHQPARTPAQKHTDEALDRAETGADQAIEAATESIEWLDSIGADVPKQLRTISTLIGQLQTFIADERKRRR